MTQWQDGYGVKIADLDESTGFSRQGKPVDPGIEEAIFTHLRQALVTSSEYALNELLQVAVAFCHAESAGISLEEEGQTGELQFLWPSLQGPNSARARLEGLLYSQIQPGKFSAASNCLLRVTRTPLQ